MTPRAEDHQSGLGRTGLIWWRRLGRDLVTMVAVGLAAYSVHVAFGEGAKRRNETCRLFERQEAVAVDRLRQTYAYLQRLKPKQLADPLNRAVMAQLPAVEKDARASDAPRYCDADGVGLPEPDPRIPPRPRLPAP